MRKNKRMFIFFFLPAGFMMFIFFLIPAVKLIVDSFFKYDIANISQKKLHWNKKIILLFLLPRNLHYVSLIQ